MNPAPATILEGPIVAPPRTTERVANYDRERASREIAEMVNALKDCEQVEMPLTHRFSPGIYIREIFMPAGTFVIGHKHKTQHFNIILSGRARVMMDGVIHEVAAPDIIESGGGVQKILYIEEDMRWATVHANPTDERDVVKIEESLVELSDELLSLKGDMDLDTLRMSVNQRLNSSK